MGTASEDVRGKSVWYDGKEYATLDFTSPRTAEVGSQTSFLKLPEGWVLAEKSEGVVEEVIRKFAWGTVCAELAADDHCARAMARLWETGEFADCEVACNGHVFQCHRAVLAQASPVFKQMLSGEMVEAKARRIQLEALENETEAASTFLAFVYTGKLDCKSEHFPTVVKLADFYQLDITAKTCNGMLQALDKGNVVPMVRLFKSVREKPRVGPYWTKLADRVHQSKELTIALMSGT